MTGWTVHWWETLLCAVFGHKRWLLPYAYADCIYGPWCERCGRRL